MTTRTRTPSRSTPRGPAPTSVTARGIVAAASAATLLFAVLEVALTGHVGLVFDVGFVAVCVTSALCFRRADFFTGAVMPPLMFAATVGLVALVAPATLTDDSGGFGEGLLGGLATNAGWLAAGYAGSLLTLAARAASSVD